MGLYASKDDIHCHRICISHTDMVWLFLLFRFYDRESVIE
ncbi:hypothetical protein Vc3S01_A1594 [Vibrio campbellii]|nr:hypothetical protein Vc3S01_A1594 [Vibrio campbellii]